MVLCLANMGKQALTKHMTRNKKHIELAALRRQTAEHEYEHDTEEQERQTVNLQTADPSSQTVSQTEKLVWVLLQIAHWNSQQLLSNRNLI